MNNIFVLDANFTLMTRNIIIGVILIIGLISRQLDGIEFKGLRYALVNSDLDYDDNEHYLKENVVKFINEHFNDYERYKQSIIDYNAYMNTDAKIIISTFVGCGECLKS